jgi:hypothetical protein
MARRSMGMADVKEILVAWDAGEGVGAISRWLCPRLCKRWIALRSICRNIPSAPASPGAR